MSKKDYEKAASIAQQAPAKAARTPAVVTDADGPYYLRIERV
jgi:hypothetical protein